MRTNELKQKKVCINMTYDYYIDDKDGVKLSLDFEYDIGNGLKNAYKQELNEEEMKYASDVYKTTSGAFHEAFQVSDRGMIDDVYMGENNSLKIYDSVNVDGYRKYICTMICSLAREVDTPIYVKSEFDDMYYYISDVDDEDLIKTEINNLSDYIKEEYSKSNYWKKTGQSEAFYEALRGRLL